MRCPACRYTELQSRRLRRHNLTIERCPDCEGIWFDPGEVETILPDAAPKLRVPRGAEPMGRFCPVCDIPLLRCDYPRTLVKVDVCKRCRGVWLDAGELAEIQAVRERLRKRGDLADEARGVGGALRRFIESALESLKPGE